MGFCTVKPYAVRRVARAMSDHADDASIGVNLNDKVGPILHLSFCPPLRLSFSSVLRSLSSPLPLSLPSLSSPSPSLCFLPLLFMGSEDYTLEENFEITIK